MVEPPLAAGEESRSRANRVDLAIAAADDAQLTDIARKILADDSLVGDRRKRMAIEDLVWAIDEHPPTVSTRVRRDVARALDISVVVVDGRRFVDMIAALWDIEPVLGWSDAEPSLRKEIMRHVVQHDDWSAEELFIQLGAIDNASDSRFLRFVEALSTGWLLADESLQRRVVAQVNVGLHHAGLELGEIGEADGYPEFRVRRVGAEMRAPRNLIFAGLGSKPDMRVLSAIDNDLEILGDESRRALVYSRSLADGLTWRQLQQWWADTTGEPDPEAAKNGLYRRLRACLPKSSPPQRYLFDSYYKVLGDRAPMLPALLPEVWLHWDPKTIGQRGVEALTNHRIDFLILPPDRSRIVLEVDGQQHYSSNGQGNPQIYAAMARGDRDLKLAGYEVYRFGASELATPTATFKAMEPFVRELFHLHRIKL